MDLVDRGLIRIMDLLFIRKEVDGWVSALAVADLDSDRDIDLAIFEGASAGRLGSDDVADAATVINPGCSAGIIVYENVRAAPLAAALRRGGGQLVASRRIPVHAAPASLEAAEVGRWASPEQQDASQPSDDEPPAPESAAGDSMNDKLGQLRELGELKSRGVLTEASSRLRQRILS